MLRNETSNSPIFQSSRGRMKRYSQSSYCSQRNFSHLSSATSIRTVHDQLLQLLHVAALFSSRLSCHLVTVGRSIDSWNVFECVIGWAVAAASTGWEGYMFDGAGFTPYCNRCIASMHMIYTHRPSNALTPSSRRSENRLNGGSWIVIKLTMNEFQNLGGNFKVLEPCRPQINQRQIRGDLFCVSMALEISFRAMYRTQTSWSFSKCWIDEILINSITTSVSNSVTVFLTTSLIRNHALIACPAGIGTYSEKQNSKPQGFLATLNSNISAAADQAVGTSFVDHVVAGYRFLMRYYLPNDAIYIFGFSRGAYTGEWHSHREVLYSIMICDFNEQCCSQAPWKLFSSLA